MNSKRRYSYSIFLCFIYGLEENNSKPEVIFAVNVMPNLSNIPGWGSNPDRSTRRQAR